jgi:hypothetical protein
MVCQQRREAPLGKLYLARADSAMPFHHIVECFPDGNMVNAELHRQPKQMTLSCVRTQA